MISTNFLYGSETGYDFLRLYATGTDHTGIVYTSQQTSIGDIIRELMPIYQVPDTEEMQGHTEYL